MLPLATNQVQGAKHAGEHVVEVVGQATGELADGFHFLCMPQCFLGAFALGHLDMQPAVDRRQFTGALGHASFQAVVKLA